MRWFDVGDGEMGRAPRARGGGGAAGAPRAAVDGAVSIVTAAEGGRERVGERAVCERTECEESRV